MGVLYSGLEEFVNEPIVGEPKAKKPVVESSEAKTSTDKPTAVRKNNGATIIEDWVSDSEEEDVPQAKIEKKTVKPSFAKIKFVKSKEQVKTPRKTTVKQDNQNRLNIHSPRENQINWNNMMSQKLGNCVLKMVIAVVDALVLGNPYQDLQKKGVIDSGCSRHMIGNMSYLTDFEEIDGGYLAFRGNPKGGKITSRGKTKTGNLDFENVYFVRQLNFNLFSVSQMCDKKNSVLFNDTECIVLSPNFKLTDESHVLLKVPRKNNMYSVDLKNIVPKGGLTCLFAKAASDESKLWHRRLGHINFKTMNKLVKGNFVRARTPQQNRVAERKNRTLIEAARTMLADSKLPTTFWAEVVNTACYVQNRVLVTKPHNKTPYELFLGRKLALGFMRPFGCPITILSTIDHLGKFNGKADEGFFVGYLINSKAFRVFNSRTRIVEENMHVHSKSSPDAGFKPLGDDEKNVNEEPGKKGGYSSKDSKSNDQEEEDNVNNTNTVNAGSTNEVNVVGAKTSIELPDDLNMLELEDIVYSGDDEDVAAEADINNLDAFMPVSPIPTTRIHKDHPVKLIIGDLNSAPQTRRMTKNLEEHEGIDYDEVFAPVARIEAIRLFLACVSFKDFVVYQMDVKSSFLYGKIEEEVYVCQPPGFEDPDFPDRRGKIYKTLFIRRDKGLQVKQKKDGIFISQDKYVTEILKKFGFTDVKTASTPMETQKLLLKDEYGEEVDVHLYRSMIGSLMYLTSSRPDIMLAICSCTRYQVNPKVSHLHAVKRIFRYLKGQPKLGLWYPKDSPFDLVAYTDSDYAGASLDRKSTIREAEYVAASKLLSGQCIGFKINVLNMSFTTYKAFDNEIGVNVGDSKLMLLGINLLLLGKVNAARHKLTAAREMYKLTTAWSNFEILLQ
ncbi:ribonuclease H-like domain-containing protein [Tanacetum coccineum]